MQPPTDLAAELRLPTNWLDYAILAIYFVVVLGIGFAARRSVKTSLDFFLSGRSLPAWVTGLAFIAANLGANFVSAIAGFVAGAVAMVAVSLFTAPKRTEDRQGLVYGTTSPGMEEPPAKGDDAWYRSPALLGWGAVILAAACYIPFSF